MTTEAVSSSSVLGETMVHFMMRREQCLPYKAIGAVAVVSWGVSLRPNKQFSTGWPGSLVGNQGTNGRGSLRSVSKHLKHSKPRATVRDRPALCYGGVCGSLGHAQPAALEGAQRGLQTRQFLLVPHRIFEVHPWGCKLCSFFQRGIAYIARDRHRMGLSALQASNL